MRGLLSPLLPLAALAAALLGCAGPAPTVEILGASPEALAASDDARDDLTITVRYSDADGDLGQGTARVTDCGAGGLTTLIPIPRIAAEEAVVGGLAIVGEMALVVADIGMAPPANTVPPACAELGVESADGGGRIFCVSLTDTAGHESEGACTRPITVGP
jgi:hypothetical protein